jgi:cysteine desulfurase/selenocysteine lyase
MNPEFPLEEELIYLNHAAVAPWPLRTSMAVKKFADENLHQGARGYPGWLEVERNLKHKLASLINARSLDEISLLKNTSEALSTIAYGLDWQPGDNVVIFSDEFPSNRIVWESLKKLGVEIRQLALRTTSDPEAHLIANCDSRTRLVSVSSVQYADGFRLDLISLGERLHRKNILFCVDAIQSLGALDFDVRSCNADFVMADGHKWMLGPEGLALFYVREEIRNLVSLNQYGWHMIENPGDFNQKEWTISSTGSRFECGSPNMLGIHALDASLGLLLETGLKQIEQSVLENTDYLISLIQQSNTLQLLTCPDTERRSGIVTFARKDAEANQLHSTLMSQGVICANRGGGIRFSPHFYTEKVLLDKAVLLASTL